jgi:hypothetical protein
LEEDGNASSDMALFPQRRLSMTFGGVQNQISLRWASNIAIARLTETQVILAYSDYGYDRTGRLAKCEVSGSSLACGSSIQFTTEPIHHDPQSLTIVAVKGDEVFIAWKQGNSPFTGHVQACKADGSLCGTELEVSLEWGCVAAVALSQTVVAIAYTDVQRGHRGSVQRCGVNNLALNCLLAHPFEYKPTGQIALAALTSDNLPYLQETTDLLLAYQVGMGTERSGHIQACELVGLGLVCYPQSSIVFHSGSSAGISIIGLAAEAFVVGFADTALSCLGARATRRRAHDVCTLTDGHSSIARMKLCRVRFRGLGVSSPTFECSESSVVDDGYTTGAPYFARLDGTPAAGDPTPFLTTYVCSGCGDIGENGIVRSCTAPALPAAPIVPSQATCSAAVVVNNGTTRWPSVAAIDGGYVVSFDDYAGLGYASARLIL